MEPVRTFISKSVPRIAPGPQRHLLEVCGYTDVKLLRKDDAHFAAFRNSLYHRMKELTHQGVGKHKHQADAVTTQDEETAWNTNTVNLHSVQALIYMECLYRLSTAYA